MFDYLKKHPSFLVGGICAVGAFLFLTADEPHTLSGLILGVLGLGLMLPELTLLMKFAARAIFGIGRATAKRVKEVERQRHCEVCGTPSYPVIFRLQTVVRPKFLRAMRPENAGAENAVEYIPRPSGIPVYYVYVGKCHHPNAEELVGNEKAPHELNEYLKKRHPHLTWERIELVIVP